jgi:signal transduction histidine kinase
MSQETLTHIFEPFYSSSASGGTGLGMVIIKSIIDAHRGVIDIESREGEGTAIHMRIPALG